MELARESLRIDPMEWLASKKIAKLLCLILVVAEVIGVLVFLLKLDLSPSSATTATPTAAAHLHVGRSTLRADEYHSSTGALALADRESAGERLDNSEPLRITWQRLQYINTTQSQMNRENNSVANPSYGIRIASAITETSPPIHTYKLPTPDPLPSFETPASKYGYVVAEHFWDQQTYSVSNIVGLQRWAGWVGSRVVEPFLVKTKFKVPLGSNEAFHGNGTVSYLRMGDMYDLDHWNELSGEQHIPFVTSWETFITEAPKQVILIDMNFTKEACLDEQLSDKYKRTLGKFEFYVVRRACIVLDVSRPLSLVDFNNEVFGAYSPQDVSVVFHEWSYRIVSHIKSDSPIIHLNDHTHIRPSAMLLSDAERYINRYLLSAGRYTGVLLRTEWILRRSKQDQKEGTLQACLNKALGYLYAMRPHSALFLGMDVGKYGSQSLADLRKDYVNEQVTKLFRTLYPGSNTTISQWEHTFESVSHSKEPGYIAFLQKVVAIQGNCLLLIGQGYFQRQALDMYKRTHHPSTYCYVSVDGWCKVMKKHL